MSSDETERQSIEGELLVPQETYMLSGIHIGTEAEIKAMREFIYKVRNDGIHIFDLKKIDERIRIAARMLSHYEPGGILAVAASRFAVRPVQRFSQFTGASAFVERFTPGLLTNPNLPGYMEPQVILLSNTEGGSQVVSEAALAGIPLIAFCDSNSPIDYVDLIIPMNNRSRKSLALAYWLLARQLLRERGQLGTQEDLPVKPEDFEMESEEGGIER
ncbi:MAG TPA: 30S ribosomal protein S2 [Thermoprotei archaeon]|nr:30S ribosomal protein S2 [TACK group archaeon]HEV51487.1 30S ribosomal protein S2 [Thermoprotei archaeon]